jgi:tetratricopeptide (TPR) repeat protein
MLSTSRSPAAGRFGLLATWWAVVLLGLSGCDSPSTGSSAEGNGRRLSIAVLPFEVQGQSDGAEYLGEALARSIAAGLERVPDLLLVDPGSAEDRAPDRRVTGVLQRIGAADRVVLRVVDASRDEPVLVTEAQSGQNDLPGIVARLTRDTVEGLGLSYPLLHDYIVNLHEDPRAPDSPLLAKVRDAARDGDVATFLSSSSAMASEFPTNSVAHALNGWALMLAWDAKPSDATLGLLKERLVELDRVDPESPYDELLGAYVYRTSGEPEPARRLYSRVLARADLTNAARAWALRQRSFTYLQVGNAEAARDDSLEALGLDPSNALSLVALSKALDAAGDAEGAIQRAKQALTLEPGRWRHLQRLGILYTHAGSYDRGIPTLRQACETGETQEACANLSVALQEAGLDDEAREVADRAESLAGTRWGYYNLGCYRALAGQTRGAVVDLRKALDLGYADALITTDTDLQALRGDPDFEALVAEVAQRLKSLQQSVAAAFPWQ